MNACIKTKESESYYSEIIMMGDIIKIEVESTVKEYCLVYEFICAEPIDVSPINDTPPVNKQSRCGGVNPRILCLYAKDIDEMTIFDK